MVFVAGRSNTHRPTILIADDDVAMRALLRASLERADYVVRDVEDGRAVLAEVAARMPDVALIDVGMPGMDGLEVTRRLREQPATALLPIILVTARGRTEDKVAGLDAGASDFITKPFEPAELLARVRTNLRLSSALTRLESTQDVLVALANAVEAKDPVTEHHCDRVADLALTVARGAGLDDEAVEAIGYGAVLHDIGKIGIPESILMKRGLLTDLERKDMQRHPLIGAEILRPLRLGQMVAPIVRGHHEHWDGSGYPDGLLGEEIPIEARIVSIADAYDAMTHDRPYRQGMDVAAAANELRRTRGGQFEPDLVDLLLEILREPRWAEGRSVNARSADADFADAFLRGLHAGSLSGAVGG